MNSKNPKVSHLRTKGFALVVTLSLMILLTVIAVGLLTLSSISLRSSSQGEAMATARANARMALMMALGDLQREMGPDSRISASHDAGTDATGGDPHWTAVYDAWQRPAGAAKETPESRIPKFRGWLASGANQALGGPAGTTDRALLVGPGSLGGASSPLDEVRVPMHKVNVNSRSSRFAWWISDEGTKAKINAGPDAVAASSFGKADPLLHSQSPPNVEHRAFPKLAALTWDQGKRAKTISTGQVTLAAALGSGGLGNSIHDLTVHSAGVLANVRDGRLQRDLGNLLARPVAEVTDKPLYLADGRMNRFNVTAAGAVSNGGGVKTWDQAYNTADHWGINLEELHLFQNLHRELNWSGGKPGMLVKSTREAVVGDRFNMYRRPSIHGLQFIFSLEAVPTATGASTYKMQMNLDAMVVLHNPNDLPLQYPAGLVLPFQLLNIPYELNWNIQKAKGGVINTKTKPANLNVFFGHVEGGSAGVPAAGFNLDPGEAAVFGSSIASGFNLNLRRGFVPSGGVKLTGWNLQASNLEADDTVNFDFKRITSFSLGSKWTYYNAWIGQRDNSSNIGWQMDSAELLGGSLSNIDQSMPPSIRPQSTPKVSSFINTPKPVLMISFLQNVEQATSTTPPDAFASRPFQLNEPALTERTMNPDRMLSDRHATQMLITAEPMNFQFRTLAAGAGGRNMFIGGGRQLGLGSFNAISRRIPVSPPQSLGAFQNAIASGFSDHFHETTQRSSLGGNPLAVGGDPFPASAKALTGHVHALPLVSKAIGNSYNVPHLPSDKVFQQTGGITSAVRATAGNVATDHSWMANTALWDSWFLSSIVDGTGAGSSAWLTDNRSPRGQFSDLAEGKKTLRNKRFLFHPHKPAAEALTDLFNGENLKPAAINTLAKYLLIDGAFNVNSTSIPAWTAFLSSVRDQALMTGSGSTKAFNHPLGTLGYATSTATSGTEGDWSGLRDLSETEIKNLAPAVVTEVKNRGPFLSLADFVNRRPNSSDPAQQTLGALQAAIDLSGLNDSHATGQREANSADFAPLSGSSGIDKEPKPARAIGSPGHLSQGSLLTAIGSQITVRSDTFTIRAYGDSRNASDKIVATAWCEAVVQRVPEYVDPTNSPEAQNAWPNPSDTLTPVNTLFGRRMEIRSFRWLASAEI